MLENYVNKSKNIIIVGGIKEGRQTVLMEAVELASRINLIAVTEESPEIQRCSLPSNKYINRNIISVQLSNLHSKSIIVAESPTNKRFRDCVAVTSIRDVAHIISNVIPNSKYAIIACDKLTAEIKPYADVLVQLMGNSILDSTKELGK